MASDMPGVVRQTNCHLREVPYMYALYASCGSYSAIFVRAIRSFSHSLILSLMKISFASVVPIKEPRNFRPSVVILIS